MTPRIELVCTGTELLCGLTLNTHARVLGEALASAGLDLGRETTVPDGREAIAGAVGEALRRADAVFVSGGLGPTPDDLTCEALAGLLGRAIVSDPAALRAIRRRCARLGRSSTPAQERQARVLSGAVPLSNPAGMAPGQWLEDGGRLLVLLPGPPREFSAVLSRRALPRLRRRFPVPAPREARLRICGLPESDLVVALEREGFDPGSAGFACCARAGLLDVRIRAPAAAAADVRRAASVVRRIAGDRLVGESLRPMEEVVIERLRAARRTVAVAESCTGGLVGGRLSAVPGSSEVFLGGVIAYSNDAKVRLLGVKPLALAEAGAVSEPVARQMARGVRSRLRADLGLSVTGIAGPGGGTVRKPVGLVWIGWAAAEGGGAERFLFSGDRESVREAATHRALDRLRRFRV